MGSSGSKAAKAATKLSANSTARKYPTRTPTAFTNTSNATRTEAAQPSTGHGLGPIVHPGAHATGVRDAAVQRDASDPDLEQAHSLRARQLGVVTPNPTQSNSSTFNASKRLSTSSPNPRSPSPTSSPSPPTATATAASFKPSASAPSQSIFPTRQNPAVSLLTARYRLAEEAEAEFAALGRKGSEGRSFLDVQTLRQVLVLRGKGVGDGDIEKKLELRRGVVRRLGEKGVVGLAE